MSDSVNVDVASKNVHSGATSSSQYPAPRHSVMITRFSEFIEPAATSASVMDTYELPIFPQVDRVPVPEEAVSRCLPVGPE